MRKFLPVFIVAGLFFSCQREEADAPFATDTDISVLPSTETKASDNGLLGWVALTGQTHISAEEAQETALATAMQMREVEGIVTKTPLKIGSIEVVKGDTRKPYVPTKGNTKPEQADVYIVNFANNQGYVITSADRRVPSVLAYNSYGHLGDTISNPGQAILFSYMQEYIEEQRAAFEANKERLATEAEEKLFKALSKEQQEELILRGLFDRKGKRVKTKYYDYYGDDSFPREGFNSHEEYWEWFCHKKDRDPEYMDKGYTKYGEWQTKYLKAPLIKTLWDQIGTYNNKVSMQCGNDQAPVGCVATAVGQFMAYYKKPADFKGRKMHWDDMTKVDVGDMFSTIDNYSVGYNSTAKEDIQYLLAHLGDSDYLNMNYGCGGSGSTIYRAATTLAGLGYPVRQTNYDENLVTDLIKRNHPVYIRGRAIEKSYNFLGFNIYNTYNGHAWLIDGYVVMERNATTYSVVSCEEIDAITSSESYSIESLYLFHNNFGWGGNTKGFGTIKGYNGTGWYNVGVFNAKDGRKFSSNTFKSDSEGNYEHDKKIIYVNR